MPRNAICSDCTRPAEIFYCVDHYNQRIEELVYKEVDKARDEEFERIKRDYYLTPKKK